MTPKEIAALVAKLEAASYAYHNGLEPVMTDEAYDTAVEMLREASPAHPFFTKVGAPVSAGDEVALPIPLPSLNKAKDAAALAKWTSAFPAARYHISAKLDGCSALWLPGSKKLFTRGDGMRGRDISAFVPYFKGLQESATVIAVRGELIMETASPVIPAGKLARNIVAGALNRKAVDPALFSEIRFVAYELIQVATSNSASASASAASSSPELSPEDAYKLMKDEGFETSRAVVISGSKMTPDLLSEIFSKAEGKSPYQMDGIVIAPNQARPVGYAPAIRKGDAVNPADRVAWKQRVSMGSARTTVRAVEWNVSHLGFLIPRVLFDPIILSGATIAAATGLHGRWIYDNVIGPGAEIEVRRAGDVIPQILAVHSPAPEGPAMPPRYVWADADATTSIHIQPFGEDSKNASNSIKLAHALGELGAENVGPGIVAKLYSAGYRTLKEIYAASLADFAARLEGIREKGADRIYQGLRASAASWTTLNFLVASSTMPRGVGHSKLAPLLAINPRVETWTASQFKAAKPAGLSDKTIDAIVEAVPAYLAWFATTGFSATASATSATTTSTATPIPVLKPSEQMVVVFTGVRDKSLEAYLESRGHVVADTVTKKTTHVIHADNSAATSGKITKAEELGIPILSLSEFKANLGL